MADTREVTATMTVDEARALLCNRDGCDQHSPADKGNAWSKLARATQLVTRSDHPDQPATPTQQKPPSGEAGG